jgi:tetratricopeptide (TPR) repeat protein
MIRKHRAMLTLGALSIVLSFGMRSAEAQGVTEYVAVSTACNQLNQTAIKQVDDGRLQEVETTISAALATSKDVGPSCVGLVLNNLAVATAVSGQVADAERFAERSVYALQRTSPPLDLGLLRPLHTLAGLRLEQGKKAKAKEAFEYMRFIRTERPADRALVHSMGAALLQAEGRPKEAEIEYTAALAAWDKAGRGNTADAAAVLNSLASLYVEGRQFNDARVMLDRALAIFTTADDAVVMDRIKLLAIRAALHARIREWHEAERDLHDAVHLADRESNVDPLALRSLLTNYDRVLRKNHCRKEAQLVEQRLTTLKRDYPPHAVVNVSDLLSKRRRPEQ